MTSLKSIVERLEAEVRKDEQIGYPHDKPSLLLQEARKALDQFVAALLAEARAEGAQENEARVDESTMRVLGQ